MFVRMNRMIAFALGMITVGALSVIAAPPTYAQTTDCREDFYIEQHIADYSKCAEPPTPSCAIATEGGTTTGPLVGSTNIEKAYNFFVSKGLQPYQAAGILGNLMKESGVNPLAVNPDSKAYGIAQWLGARKTKLLALNNYQTIEVQLNYLWSELTGPYSGVLKQIKASTNVADATYIFLTKFEIPCIAGSKQCDAEQKSRLEFSNKVLAQYGGGVSTGTGGTAPTSCTVPDTGVPGGAGSTSSRAGRYDDPSITCPAGTTDKGTVKTQYTGDKVPNDYPTIRLCALSSISRATVNAAVAGQFQTMGVAAKAAGHPLVAESSFRLASTAGGNGDGRRSARAGKSYHQLGIAIDFVLIDKHTGTSTTSCSQRTTSRDPDWIWMRDNASKYGIRQYTYENWHWDTSGDPNRC